MFGFPSPTALIGKDSIITTCFPKTSTLQSEATLLCIFELAETMSASMFLLLASSYFYISLSCASLSCASLCFEHGTLSWFSLNTFRIEIVDIAIPRLDQLNHSMLQKLRVIGATRRFFDSQLDDFDLRIQMTNTDNDSKDTM